MEKQDQMDCVLVTVTNKAGFKYGFTLRGETLEKVFEKINVFENKAAIEEWIPEGHIRLPKATTPAAAPAAPAYTPPTQYTPPAQPAAPYTQPGAISAPENLGNCEKCGAPNARSRKGSVYCTAKCWLRNAGR